jgi:hypothetical protein
MSLIDLSFLLNENKQKHNTKENTSAFFFLSSF